jgi:hypothetical protein
LARRAEMVPESWVADGRASAGLVPYFDQSAEGVADVIARQVEDAQQDFRRDRGVVSRSTWRCCARRPTSDHASSGSRARTAWGST